MKTLLQNLKLIVIGSVLAIGASYAYAGVYNAPTGTPPANNTDTPVHVGTADQVKIGGLSVNAFNATQNALFDQTLFMQGIVRGNTTPNSTVSFGDAGHGVSLHATGGLFALQTITSNTLQNPGVHEVCADQAGTLVLCAGASTPSSTNAFTSVICSPEDHTQAQGNVYCNVAMTELSSSVETINVDITFTVAGSPNPNSYTDPVALSLQPGTVSASSDQVIGSLNSDVFITSMCYTSATIPVTALPQC